MRSSDKRHAKPSSAQLIHRVYRQQIALRAQIDTIKSGQAMLSERMESFRVLADHCARLLREKETLMKMGSLHTDYERLVERFSEQVKQANNFMARGPNGQLCPFESTHRPTIPCGVCGITPPGNIQ